MIHAPLTAFAIAVTAEALLTGILLAAYYSRASRDLSSWRFDMEVARRLVRQGLPLLLSGVAITIYMKIDLIMLGQMLGDKAVGIYSAVGHDQ